MLQSGIPRHVTAKLLTRRYSPQYHTCSTHGSRPEQPLSSIGKKSVSRLSTIQSNALRQEIQEVLERDLQAAQHAMFEMQETLGHIARPRHERDLRASRLRELDLNVQVIETSLQRTRRMLVGPYGEGEGRALLHLRDLLHRDVQLYQTMLRPIHRPFLDEALLQDPSHRGRVLSSLEYGVDILKSTIHKAKETMLLLRRDIAALQSGKSEVKETTTLGNQQELHRAEASETVTFGVPKGGSGLTDPVNMSALIARDSCTCPICVDPSSKQKHFQTSDIPPKIKATSTLDPEKQTLEITWTNDIPGFPKDHVTRFDLKPASVTCKDSVYHPLEPKNRLVWDGKTIAEKNKWIPYDRYMADDTVLHEALEQLGRYGLVFLTDVPDSEKAVEHIVGRIGLLKDTFYGRTWDVKSIPNAKNIAYTHQYLGLHMDLMYVTNPPHLQLLHSLRAQSPGGASLFSDSLHAAFTLERTDRAAFDILTKTPVPFHYKNDGQSYAKWRPTIELAAPLAGLSPNPPHTAVSASADDPALGTSLASRELLDGGGSAPPRPPRIKCINYSPPFQAPFFPTAAADLGLGARNPLAASTFAQLRRALRKFAALVEAPEALFEHRLDEGQCVVFDNRRVLHARRAFDASQGERWLKGAYVDDDVFFSRWRVLAEKAAGREGERERIWEGLYGGKVEEEEV